MYWYIANKIAELGIALIRIAISMYGSGQLHLEMKAPYDMRFKLWKE